MVLCAYTRGVGGDMGVAAKSARVVVVDDEPALAYLFAQYLQSSFFQVEWFSSPTQVLDFLGRQPADLLVSDLIMPGINGLELIGLAKDLQPALKVVMVSGLDPWSWCKGENPNLQRLDSFLGKPVPLSELERCCRQVLRGPTAQRGTLSACLRAAFVSC